jgi:DNA-binding PadR family transcriptional regulator
MENSNELVQNMILELRRGAIILAVLSQLGEEQYGYSLLKRLSDQGLEIDQGTLYPLMRRLESQGLLQSDWRIADEARPRRYYVLNDQGRLVLGQMKQEWERLSGVIDRMLAAG